MRLHLLLTNDIREKMPSTTKIINEWGMLRVMFGQEKSYYGLHCFVEDTEENLINWLKQFDGFLKGDGSPVFETFEIVHISDNA